MIKDNTLYVYYELDLKSEKISYIQCALSYGGLPVISDDLKERVAYIPNNKANEISLRIPLNMLILIYQLLIENLSPQELGSACISFLRTSCWQ